MKDSRIIAKARTGFSNSGTTISVLSTEQKILITMYLVIFFIIPGSFFVPFPFEIIMIILSFYFSASRPEGQLDKIYIKPSYPRASGQPLF